MAKEINYTNNDRAIVAALKTSNEGMTLSEISAAAKVDLVPGHIVSAMRKGLVAKVGERQILKSVTRKVYTYSFVTADKLNKADGKAFEYSDNETTILSAAAKIGKPFTLKELSDFIGTPVSSGSTNGLIRKGNLVKGDQVEVKGTAPSTVSVYKFVNDIPEDK